MTEHERIGVGIIGCGGRGIHCLSNNMARAVHDEGLVVTALCDILPDRVSEMRDVVVGQFAEQGVEVAPAVYTEHRQLIDDPGVDLVVITTHSYQHRDPALAAITSGKKVYLDKPIAHNLADAEAIYEAEKAAGRRLIMGFTRRYEAPWRKAWDLVREGAVGRVFMLQIRAVVPYTHYFQTWHRRREWSGGALNDKSSHHCDVFNWFAESRCEKVSAFGGQTGAFASDPHAPARCLECDRECPYRRRPSRTLSPDEVSHQGDSWTRAAAVIDRQDNCVYLPGADIHDHAICHFAYENGVKASLFWTIIGPRAEDQETFEIVGTCGRIHLIRHTGTLDVVRDHGREHEEIDCRSDEFQGSHFGADRMLIHDLRRFAAGEEPVVSAREGYEATRMVMNAHRSIDNGGILVE